MKLKALKRLANYLPKDDMISEDELRYALDFARTIQNKSTGPIGIAACAAGLDLIIPGWREAFPASFVGLAVERESKEVAKWRRDCLKRDGHKCVNCSGSDNISVHHVCSWSEFPELRLEVDNGETLCGVCHSAQHPNLSVSFFVKNSKISN